MKLHYTNYTLFLHIQHVSLYCQHLAWVDRTASFFLAFLSVFCFQIVIFVGGNRVSLKENPAYGIFHSAHSAGSYARGHIIKLVALGFLFPHLK